MKIYHNPKCSKSRRALEILRENGHDPEIIEYLKTPLTKPDLIKLYSLLGDDQGQFVRTKEKPFHDLGLSLQDHDRVLSAMEQNPILMERPIVVSGDKAVIGRPPEKIEALLST